MVSSVHCCYYRRRVWSRLVTVDVSTKLKMQWLNENETINAGHFVIIEALFMSWVSVLTLSRNFIFSRYHSLLQCGPIRNNARLPRKRQIFFLYRLKLLPAFVCRVCKSGYPVMKNKTCAQNVLIIQTYQLV